MSTSLLHKSDFTASVLASDRPVLVDFFATWCAPCRMLAPILEGVEEKHSDKVSFYKVDIDEDAELARYYGVMSVPTLILFRNGEPSESSVGLVQAEEIEKLIGVK